MERQHSIMLMASFDSFLNDAFTHHFDVISEWDNDSISFFNFSAVIRLVFYIFIIMKYLIVVLAIIFYANFAYASDNSPNSVHSKSHRQGKTLDGGLTSGFTTALSSLGTIGVLGLILVGILLLPTILSVLFANPILKRSVIHFC